MRKIRGEERGKYEWKREEIENIGEKQYRKAGKEDKNIRGNKKIKMKIKKEKKKRIMKKRSQRLEKKAKKKKKNFT